VIGPDHAARLARATAALGRAGIDALAVGPSPDMRYLVGHAPRPTERLTLLVVRPGADPVLVVPELERALAEGSPAARVAEVRAWPDGADPYGPAGAALAGAGRVAVGEPMWAAHLLGLQEALPDAAFEGAGRVMGALRAVKDAAELDALRRAARAADAAFAAIRGSRLARRSELDVADELAGLLVEHGHDRAGFTIVASGPNAASPHHEPGERRLVEGDAVVVDFGGELDGYCSDLSRTVVVAAPPRGFVEVYDLVRGAQQVAFEAVRPGVTAAAIDRAARAVIADAGFGDAFVHRTGHGIGLEVHEDPYLVEGNDEVLRPGTTFSIEPGVYLDGRFGVRIEDIVVVTDGGAERLNEAPRDLVVVG
jgi:D-alanyl-D-alanine dipeptidase